MTRCWLLQLGSNLPDAALLHAAQARLATLGSVQQLIPIQHLRPADGSGDWYFNTLLTLDSHLGAEHLRPALHQIEQELGRDRGDKDRVAIDIDVLAWQQPGGWQADSHALAKGELTRWPTSHLLDLAGLSLALDTPVPPESNRG